MAALHTRCGSGFPFRLCFGCFGAVLEPLLRFPHLRTCLPVQLAVPAQTNSLT